MGCKRIGYVVVLLAFHFLGGCAPALFTQVPGFHGRIVDTQGQPVPGVGVHVTRVPQSWGPYLDVTLVTDGKGRFRRSEDAAWGIFIVPMDTWIPSYQAQANGEGRESKVVAFGGRMGGMRLLGVIGLPTDFDLGDLVLPPP